MPPLERVGFHVSDESAAEIAAYVPLNPSFVPEYDVYPEIVDVLPWVATRVPFITSRFVSVLTNLIVT